jgi:hypothetical protein
MSNDLLKRFVMLVIGLALVGGCGDDDGMMGTDGGMMMGTDGGMMMGTDGGMMMGTDGGMMMGTDGGMMMGTDGGMMMGTDGGMTTAPTWTTVYTTIIQPGCSCHVSGASGSLAMPNQATAYTNLVGVSADGLSCGSSGLDRVVAGDADSSLLYQKVAGTASCGARMPFMGAPLPAGQVADIQAWINAGAMND